jgi:hypothetical protein
MLTSFDVVSFEPSTTVHHSTETCIDKPFSRIVDLAERTRTHLYWCTKGVRVYIFIARCMICSPRRPAKLLRRGGLRSASRKRNLRNTTRAGRSVCAPARKWRAGLKEGEHSRRRESPQKPKSVARNHTIPQKVTSVAKIGNATPCNFCANFVILVQTRIFVQSLQGPYNPLCT